MLGRHLRTFNVTALPRLRRAARARYCHDLDAAWRYEIDMRRRTDRDAGRAGAGQRHRLRRDAGSVNGKIQRVRHCW